MASQAINLQDSSWILPISDIPRRDFFIDFMLIVVFPLVLGLVLFIVLSILMFGRRQGLDKRNQTTPEPQLVQFDTIRRATTNLRYMSSRRDGPVPLSPRLATSTPNFPQPIPGCSSSSTAAEDNNRHSLPPPPYRLPPQYNVDPQYDPEQQYHPEPPLFNPDEDGAIHRPEPPRRSSSRTGSVNDSATLPMRSS